jgi:hypothetical protein
MNPLDTGETFTIELMNPNPTSSKTKDGPKYRVSFEIHREAWDEFMDANTQGMVLELTGRATVIPVTKMESTSKVLSEMEVPDKPKGGPISKDAAMLCQDDKANRYAVVNGFESFQRMIYETCRISSRAQLDHNIRAQGHYQELKSAFIRWAF